MCEKNPDSKPFPAHNSHSAMRSGGVRAAHHKADL